MLPRDWLSDQLESPTPPSLSTSCNRGPSCLFWQGEMLLNLTLDSPSNSSLKNHSCEHWLGSRERSLGIPEGGWFRTQRGLSHAFSFSPSWRLPVPPLGGDHVLRDQAHCVVVARGGDQSLLVQLTLINTGTHRSCLCAERGAEAKATCLATGLFPFLWRKVGHFMSLIKVWHFPWVGTRSNDSRGWQLCPHAKGIPFSVEPLSMIFHDGAGGQGASGLLEQEPPNHDQAELHLPLRPHLSPQPSSKGAYFSLRISNTLDLNGIKLDLTMLTPQREIKLFTTLGKKMAAAGILNKLLFFLLLMFWKSVFLGLTMSPSRQGWHLFLLDVRGVRLDPARSQVLCR